MLARARMQLTTMATWKSYNGRDVTDAIGIPERARLLVSHVVGRGIPFLGGCLKF